MTMLAAKLTVWALQVEDKLNKMLKDESGEANLIAIILVLAVVIILALLFKDKITGLFNSIWGNLEDDALGII